MEPKVIDWDGMNLPPQLKDLPPGRYAVDSLDPPPLSQEEEQGLLAALDQIEAGQGIPLADVVREIRNRAAGK